MNMNSPRPYRVSADCALGGSIAAGSLASRWDPAAPLKKPCALIGAAPPARMAPIAVFPFMSQRWAQFTNYLGRRALPEPVDASNSVIVAGRFSALFRPAAPNKKGQVDE